MDFGGSGLEFWDSVSSFSISLIPMWEIKDLVIWLFRDFWKALTILWEKLFHQNLLLMGKTDLRFFLGTLRDSSPLLSVEKDLRFFNPLLLPWLDCYRKNLYLLEWEMLELDFWMAVSSFMAVSDLDSESDKVGSDFSAFNVFICLLYIWIWVARWWKVLTLVLILSMSPKPEVMLLSLCLSGFLLASIPL